MDVKQILYDFRGEATSLEATLEVIRKQVKSLPEGKKIDIALETGQALIQITNLRTLLEGIRDEEVDVKVQAKLGDLISDLGKAEALIRSVPDQKNITMNIRTNVDTTLSRVLNRVREVDTGILRLEKAEQEVEHSTQSFGDIFGNVFTGASTSIRRIPPLLQGVGLVIVALLIPSILSLGEAIVGATGGLIALGAAFTAALGPSIALLAAVASRFTAILKVRQEHQAALKAETAATNAQVSADQREHDAKRATIDAHTALIRARNDYARAVATAKNQIADADRSEVRAIENLRQAQEGLKQAAVDAYEEMKRAALDAADAVLGVQEAELGVERGKLNIRKAALELRKFRHEAGLGAGSLDALFKRATDVTIDPAQARKAIGQIIKSGDELGEENAIRLRELILNLRDAKLQEKSATIQVKRATLDESDARRKAADFAKQGINASDGYRAALDRLKSAQDTANTAIRNANKLNEDGIKKNPAVVAARRSEADAEDRYNTAKTNQARAIQAAADAQKNQNTQMQQYLKDRGKLTKVEQDFADFLDVVVKAFRQTMGPATDEVFKGIEDALKIMGPIFKASTPLFKALGKAWGDLFRTFATNLVDPKNLQALQGFFAAAPALVQSFSDIMGSLLTIFVNLATAAMPDLLEMLTSFSDWLDGLAGKSTNLSGLQAVIDPMIQALSDFFTALEGFASGVIQIFIDAQGPITDFTGWIAGAAQSFDNWTKSKKGRDDINQFFEQTEPMSRAFAGDLVKAAGALALLSEVGAPAFTPLLLAIGHVLDALNTVLGLFADLFDFLDRIVPFFRPGTSQKILSWWMAGFISPISVIINGIKWILDHLDDIHLPHLPKWIQEGLSHIPGTPFTIPHGASGGIATGPTLGVWGESGSEALIPLSRSVLGALGKAIVSSTSGMLPSVSGRLPAMAGVPGQAIIRHTHFHIPRPLDATKPIDPENTAALLQQAWERRGGALS